VPRGEREALAAILGAALDADSLAAVAQAKPGAERARALVGAAERATDPEERARIVEAGFALDEASMLLDLGALREDAATMLVEGAHELAAAKTLDAPLVTRARTRLFRARYLSRRVAADTEWRRLQERTARRTDLVRALRPFIWDEQDVADLIDRFEASTFKASDYPYRSQPPELNNLQGRLNSFAGDKAPFVKLDSYSEVLVMRPDLDNAWTHVHDEATDSGRYALAARASEEVYEGAHVSYELERYGVVLLALGQNERAASALAKAWEAFKAGDSDCTEAGWYLACAHFALGDTKRMRDVIDEALSAFGASPGLESMRRRLVALRERADALEK